MKRPNTRHAAVNYCLAIAATCLVLSGCKKNEGDTSLPVNNDLFKVTLATTGGTFFSPASAVPDAADQFIYFVASDSTGAGVFKVAATGGTATKVFVGVPFSKPIDLALSTDNQTIFVADSAAGGIFSMGINGSTPVIVTGTAGTSPVALDVIQRSGQDHIYFCGTNAADGQKAVFEIVSGGAASPMVRQKGAPLISPAGIVSAKDGTLFIADAGGMVHKLVSSGTISQIANGIIMGTPAGVALTPDDHTLAVSSKSPAGTAQVQVFDLLTGSMSIFNKVIGANSNPGGLHGARNASGATGKYGWADVSRGGRVYRVEL